MRRGPCKACPWRVDADAADIPNFSLDLAEQLEATCRRDGYGQNFGDPLFACHQSRPGEEIVCAGWLAVDGHSHPNARLMVATGTLDAEVFVPGDGWPELHGGFVEVIEKLRLQAGESSADTDLDQDD